MTIGTLLVAALVVVACAIVVIKRERIATRMRRGLSDDYRAVGRLIGEGITPTFVAVSVIVITAALIVSILTISA